MQPVLQDCRCSCLMFLNASDHQNVYIQIDVVGKFQDIRFFRKFQKINATKPLANCVNLYLKISDNKNSINL